MVYRSWDGVSRALDNLDLAEGWMSRENPLEDVKVLNGALQDDIVELEAQKCLGVDQNVAEIGNEDGRIAQTQLLEIRKVTPNRLE